MPGAWPFDINTPSRVPAPRFTRFTRDARGLARGGREATTSAHPQRKIRNGSSTPLNASPPPPHPPFLTSNPSSGSVQFKSSPLLDTNLGQRHMGAGASASRDPLRSPAAESLVQRLEALPKEQQEEAIKAIHEEFHNVLRNFQDPPSVRVEILRATRLRNADGRTTSDPYCTCRIVSASGVSSRRLSEARETPYCTELTAS